MNSSFDPEQLIDPLFGWRTEEARLAGETEIRVMLLTLIEAVDAVERLAADPTSAELPPAWKEGLSALQGKFVQCLASQNVSAIPSVGLRLDPRLHRVVEVRVAPGEPETIVGVFRTGYVWKEQVLRPAEVVTIGRPDLATEENEKP